MMAEFSTNFTLVKSDQKANTYLLAFNIASSVDISQELQLYGYLLSKLGEQTDIKTKRYYGGGTRVTVCYRIKTNADYDKIMEVLHKGFKKFKQDRLCVWLTQSDSEE